MQTAIPDTPAMIVIELMIDLCIHLVLGDAGFNVTAEVVVVRPGLPGHIWLRYERQEFPGNRIDPVCGNPVVREWLPDTVGPDGSRIVDSHGSQIALVIECLRLREITSTL